MHKMFLVLQREFMSRVTKKSFLLATILVPLIFPAMIGGMIYIAIQNEKNKEQETIRILDESEMFTFDSDNEYAYLKVEGPIDSAKVSFRKSEDLALIYIPKLDIDNPSGIVFYGLTSPGINLVKGFERNIEGQIRDMKLTRSGLTNEQLKELDTNVEMSSFNLTESGDETKSDSGVTFGIGYVMGFMIYIFLFAYGAQVMQGVIEEKNSKIVEVVVSTVKPFQMMLGKVVGVASVGVVQFAIWIILMSAISFVGLSIAGLSLSPEAAQSMADSSDVQNNERVQEILSIVQDIPIMKITLLFIFYFIGGYLLYGALFAAVGSAVDTPADAQQFMMPIMLPIIAALMGLMMFVFPDPHGTVSFWLSIIPFTSPIVMMGRIGFGVPAWEIALSMVMLIGGFIFTLWVAGRIYRVGILMHGTKVNYKTLARWFMMKN